VDIVQPVTPVTARLQRNLNRILSGVACVAIEPSMGTCQGILRLPVVIEAPASPAVGIMTKGTISAEPSFVAFILVATSAGEARVFERCRSMTFFAGHDCMPANQRKPCQIVIESNCSAPTGLTVTLFTTTAELAFM
jgi:hypothetical protein